MPSRHSLGLPKVSMSKLRNSTGLAGPHAVCIRRSLLKEVKLAGVTRIVLDCAAENVRTVLMQAQQVGMMSGGHTPTIEHNHDQYSVNGRAANDRSVFTITEEAFSWLKVPTSLSHLRHYDKQLGPSPG